MTTERKLKGINFLGTLKTLGKQHGPEVQKRVEARLPGELGETFRHGALLASGWYPASWYGQLLDAIVAETRGDASSVRMLSREAVAADFKTLFKVVRLFMTPQSALKQSMRVSRRYIDGGDIEVVDAGDGHIHYRFRDYHGYSRLMWWDFIGGIEGVLTNLGAEDMTARIIEGGDDGDPTLGVMLRWRDR